MKTPLDNSNRSLRRLLGRGVARLNRKSNAIRAVVLGCALSSVCAQNAPFITRPDTESASSAPYDEYVLSNSLIRFAPVHNEKGKLLGHLATEVSPTGAPSILAQAAKYFRTPTDLFRATTSSPGTLDQFEGPTTEHGVGDCDATWAQFHYDVTSFGYGLSFLSKSDGPSAGTGHWFSSGGFLVGFYELHGRADDVSAFFLKIEFCDEDLVTPPLQGNPDPDVFLNFR